MYNGLVRIGRLTIIFRTVFQHLIFSNQIDDIKAKTLDTLVPPKIDNFEKFFADMRIAPVEISLRHIKEVQVILARCSKRRPGAAAKLRQPVCRLITQKEKILVVRIAS